MKNFENLFSYSFMSKLRLLLILLLVKNDLIMAYELRAGLLSPNSETNDDSYPILYDVKDYEDLHFIVTSGELFQQNQFTLKPRSLTPVFVDSKGNYISLAAKSVIANYISEYMLVGCSKDYFLEFFTVEGVSAGELIEYKSYSINSKTVKLSYDLVDICSLGMVAGTYSATIFLVSSILENEEIKYLIVAKISAEGTIFGSEQVISITPSNLKVPQNFKYLDCESVSFQATTTTEPYLVCGYIYIDDSSDKKYKYAASVVTNVLNPPLIVYSSNTLLHFKLQLLGDFNLRFVVGTESFELYLSYDDYENEYYVHKFDEASLKEPYLKSFLAYENLFDYNNKCLFHAIPKDDTNSAFKLYISNEYGNNIYIKTIKHRVDKILGFYNSEKQLFIYVYQYKTSSNENYIEYFISGFNTLDCGEYWYTDKEGDTEYKVCLEEEGCNSPYIYFHTDTKECDEECKDGYAQNGFQCIKIDPSDDNKGCPDNTVYNSETNECEQVGELSISIL